MIFDAFDRTDTSPKLSIETDFEFLNRSAREEMQSARDLLEIFIADYPDPSDLVSRFRSGNNVHFRSAEFELLLFTILTKRKFKLTPHPGLPNGSGSRPDFLVESPTGAFYLEAVLASEDRVDLSQNPLVATTLDVFSSNSHDNFNVIVTTSGCPTTQPSRKNLLQKTMAWLNALDPDAVQKQMEVEGHDSLPTLIWTHEHFEVALQAYPLREDRRGKSDRLLAAQFSGAGWVDSWSPIRDAIRFKGSKYGQLDLPLIVAVNFSGLFLKRMDEMQALYGQEQIVVSVVDPAAEPRMSRAPNGAWIGKAGPQCKRVSAAWLFNGLCAYNLDSRQPTLYVHPWAHLAIPKDMLQFAHALAKDGHVSWQEGVSMGDVFGAP